MTERRLNDLDKEKLQTIDKIKVTKEEGQAAAEAAEKSKVELTALRMIEESMGNEINVLRKKRDDLFKQKVRLGSDKDKITADIETAEGMIINVNTRIAQCQEQHPRTGRRTASYNIDVSNEILPSIESLKEIIRQCERAMASMGAVNLRALEDYAERKKRHDELDTEIARLSAQRDDLLKLESELGGKKKVALLRVYEGVNVNFKQAYSELSQGRGRRLNSRKSRESFRRRFEYQSQTQTGQSSAAGCPQRRRKITDGAGLHFRYSGISALAVLSAG